MLSALGLLSGALGCHTAGICDCDNHVPCCVGGGPGAEHGDAITPFAASSPETVRELPRPAGGATPKPR